MTRQSNLNTISSKTFSAYNLRSYNMQLVSTRSSTEISLFKTICLSNIACKLSYCMADCVSWQITHFRSIGITYRLKQLNKGILKRRLNDFVDELRWLMKRVALRLPLLF